MEELEKISDVNSSDDLRLRHFHDGSSHEQMRLKGLLQAALSKRFCREHLCTQLDLSGCESPGCLVQVVAKTKQQAPGSDRDSSGMYWRCVAQQVIFTGNHLESLCHFRSLQFL